jgi:hypothetical protein
MLIKCIPQWEINLRSGFSILTTTPYECPTCTYKHNMFTPLYVYHIYIYILWSSHRCWIAFRCLLIAQTQVILGPFFYKASWSNGSALWPIVASRAAWDVLSELDASHADCIANFHEVFLQLSIDVRIRAGAEHCSDSSVFVFGVQGIWTLVRVLHAVPGAS